MRQPWPVCAASLGVSAARRSCQPSVAGAAAAGADTSSTQWKPLVAWRNAVFDEGRAEMQSQDFQESANEPPRRHRVSGSVISTSAHHSFTLPERSNKPRALGAKLPTGAVHGKSSQYPGSAVCFSHTSCPIASSPQKLPTPGGGGHCVPQAKTLANLRSCAFGGCAGSSRSPMPTAQLHS